MIRLKPYLDDAIAAMRWLLPTGFGRSATMPETSYPAGGLSALVSAYPLPTWRVLARLVMAAVAVLIIWASFATLDEVAVAAGEVVPEGRVKVIQHLEGGIIRDLYVQEGAVVAEGAPLVQLDLAVTSLNREEMQVRLDGLMLQRARLSSELSGDAIAFPPAESERQPALVEAEIRNHDARRHALNATIAVLRDQERQKSAEIAELASRQRAVGVALRNARERFKMSQDLMASGLTARMEHVALEGQVEELVGQLDTTRAAIPRVEAAMAEAKSRIQEEEARFIRTVQGEMSEVELNIARTRELLSQASDQQLRTQITSPIDGVIKTLRYNTIGNVVRPGDPIMEIVPLHERLQIDTKLSPTDRGYVRVGQAATVKISAYDFNTYGGLKGEVIQVAPDTTTGPDIAPYYRVIVQTDKAYLGDDDTKLVITAGMEASVEIHTGSRTVMQYLVKPVLKLRHEAFRER